ncbi:TPA: hypothetical protein DF272_05140 [Candidatus Falkowbacteria bacterium]|nr:hypothetical protein [Candidatus Falkowbacteria bacterium]
MSDRISFIAFKAEAVPQAPKAIQDFVGDFFQPREIFGVACLVAVSAVWKSPWNGLDGVENRLYHEGLSEDELGECGIWTWFENHPELVFKFDWS